MLSPILVTNPAQADTCKTIVFKISGYSFALPMGLVNRVLHRSLLSANRLDQNLLYLDGEPIEILDLGTLLPPRTGGASRVTLGTSSSRGSIADAELDLDLDLGSEQPFLLVVNYQGKSLALAADAPPALVNLSLARVQAIPDLYRDRLRGVAEGMVVIQKADRTAALFLLNLEPAVQLLRQQLV